MLNKRKALLELRYQSEPIAEQLHGNETGQAIVEYALIIALLLFGTVLAMHGFSSDLKAVYTRIGNTVNSAVSADSGSGGYHNGDN